MVHLVHDSCFSQNWVKFARYNLKFSQRHNDCNFKQNSLSYNL
jgi:hypothetical protein